jgi:hypothetical protein
MKVVACIEDPVVMPKALATLAGQALQKILNHLKEKGEYQGISIARESRPAANALIWVRKIRS